MNLRFEAARIIHEVTNGHSLTDCLDHTLKSINDARDRAFIQAICYGVCRFYYSLDVMLSHLLQSPMKAKDSDVHALLLVGLYQLREMRVPPHAACAETVNATMKLKKPWARGLVNAVLRTYLRRQKEIEEIIASDLEGRFNHPLWWIDQLKKTWPMQWEDILLANNAHPPFALRINQRKISRSAYIEKLKSQGLNARIIPETSSGIILESPVSVDTLPAFSQGAISVQDGAAQLAAELLSLSKGQRVLDACAAPGGKLTHILEIEPELSACIAIDKDEKRMSLVKDNLSRLNLQAECFAHDVNEINAWWDGQWFDRILLDAPCSASGVVRRHPDIKLLRQQTDIKPLAKAQLHLLNSLWPLLKPDGILVYATCSVFPEENTHVIQSFLTLHSDAIEEKINPTIGLACEFGRQILPGMHNMDGFYYAKIKKIC